MFRVQFRRMIQSLGFKIAFSFMMIFCMFALVQGVIACRTMDLSAVPDANTMYCGFGSGNMWTYFTVFFPFVIVLPFATSFIQDVQSRAVLPVWVRGTFPGYLLSKLVVSFLGGILVIGIPFFVNLVLCNLIFPHNHNVLFGEYGLHNYYGLLTGSRQIYSSLQAAAPNMELYMQNPFLCNLFYLALLSIFAGLMSAVLMVLSFFLKKRKIILFFPFFIFWYGASVLTEFSYTDAVADMSVPFLNIEYMDYLAPLTLHGGWIPGYLAGLCVIFLAFIAVAFFYAKRHALKYIQEG